MQNGWRPMQMDVNMAHACKAQGYVCLVGRKTYKKVVFMGGIQINKSILIFNKYMFVVLFSKTIFILPLICRYVHHVIKVEAKAEKFANKITNHLKLAFPKTVEDAKCKKTRFNIKNNHGLMVALYNFCVHVMMCHPNLVM